MQEGLDWLCDLVLAKLVSSPDPPVLSSRALEGLGTRLVLAS